MAYSGHKLLDKFFAWALAGLKLRSNFPVMTKQDGEDVR